MTSYSQLGQDRIVLSLLNNKRNGYFVDVGAYDGVELSNTYLLETQYGWDGICIEPLPDKFFQCQKTRKCKCFQDAVYSEAGKFFEFKLAGLIGGIAQHIDRHLHALQSQSMLVITKTLTSILDEVNAPKQIDYLSLDTEGSELEILKGIDFDKYQFTIIDIEHNYVEPRRSEMRQYLQERGYKYHKANDFDDQYIHSSYFSDEEAK